MSKEIVLEIIMKHVIFLFVCFQVCFSSIFSASSESERILADVALRMDAVPLPDGCSIFGKPIINTVEFDTNHLGKDGAAAHRVAMDLMCRLKKPLKSSIFLWGDEYHSVEEIMSLYMSLVRTLYTLTSDTVVFFEGLFQYGEVCGVQIPGFDTKTPISKARYDLFKVLGKWRVHGGASQTDALEAIRVERERLDAIAKEEAKRKAEADEEVARVAAIAAAKNARAEAAEKTQDATSTLRHRKGHGTTVTPGSDTDDRRAVEKDPLLPRPIRAH
jgi:hypothetical protein